MTPEPSKHVGSTPDTLPSQYPSMKKPTKPAVHANLAKMEEDMERVCNAFDEMDMSEEDMDTDMDNDAIFNISMMKSVRIEIPGNGTVEPGLAKNRSTPDHAKANAGNRRNKRELEALLRKKVDSLLHCLCELKKRLIMKPKRNFISPPEVQMRLRKRCSNFMILMTVVLQSIFAFRHTGDTANG